MSILGMSEQKIARLISIFSPRRAFEFLRSQKLLRSADYTAASVVGPNKQWRPTIKSGDALVRTSGIPIRQRIKDLERNNGHVAGAVNRLVANVVGEGNLPQSKVRNPDGKGLDVKLADRIEQTYLRWAENCCINGDSLVDLQQMNQRAKTVDGQGFIVKVQEKRRLMLQAVEADQLAEQIDGPLQNGNYAVRGIELNRYGRPVAYHFRDVHPGDNARFSSNVVTVPADRVYHVFNRTRASQSHGISVFAAVVMAIFDAGEYADATMVLARMAAAYGIIIETDFPEDNYGGADATEESGQKYEYVNPGGFHYVQRGQKASMIKPDQPGSSYEPFMRNQLRTVATGIGQSYSAFSGDYSQGNFSSERQAMLLERALFRMECGLNDRRFNIPLFRDWMDFAVLSGDLVLPNYEANRYNLQRVKHSRPRQEYLNPLQDVQALSEEINLGVRSRTEVIEDRGQDRDDVFNALAEEAATMKALGIYQQDASVATFAQADTAKGAAPNG
jgi:lambda family phage portal protein